MKIHKTINAIGVILCMSLEPSHAENSAVEKAFEKILGKRATQVLHSPIPFDMGDAVGGASDIAVYNEHLTGKVYITTDLIGREQGKSDAGNYELMICSKKESLWAAALIGQLAYYTLEASINNGETMDIGPNVPDGSSISAVIFEKYAEATISGKKIGLMLLIGITRRELEWAHRHGTASLINKLKAKGIYPFTDLKRKSVLP